MSKKKIISWEDSYSVIEKLGKGGNGVVYLVERKCDKVRFALKTLKNCSNEKKHRFITEISTVSKYSDKIRGIIPIIDFSKNEYWYVMPVALACMKYISSNNKDITDIIKGIIQLCETLCQLHSIDISHRDIKPSNIYFYEDRYVFSDFGLVSVPNDEDHFTRSDKGLGAIFTIAPEMKRDPKHADGKKADVYSLAKTMWMFLTGDEKGFDGVYHYLDPSHSLSYLPKYKNIHLAEIHELLTEATDNNPEIRPSIGQFKKRLEMWLDIYEDEEKSQMSDWNFLDKQLFGIYSPESASWKTPEKIVAVLNIIGTTPAFNHMLFSSRGGLDFDYAKLGNEQSCIEVYADGFCHIVKPKQLIYEGFGENCEWNYFLLELDELDPIISQSEFENEMLVEDYPAHYVSASTAQYGVYDYETGEPYPDGYRVVYRYIRGKFLIVMKKGPYNTISSTYDGRHGLCDSMDFRNYIENLIKKYVLMYNKIRQDERSKKISDITIKRIILKQHDFGTNPFVNDNDDSIEDDEEIIRQVEENKASINYLKENYNQLCFNKYFIDNDSEKSKIRFYFKYVLSDDDKYGFSYDFIKKSYKYICTDGYIKEALSPLENKCYYVCDRNNAILLQQKFINAINDFLEQNGFRALEDYKQCISIKLQKTGKPSHLFSRSEIEQIMRNADDRVNNQLVIDEDGYVKIVNNSNEKLLYPVSHETWNSGNMYVGKYSQLKTLNDVYISSLQGWLMYLKTGRRQYMDYVHENKDEKTLIEEIKRFY